MKTMKRLFVACLLIVFIGAANAGEPAFSRQTVVVVKNSSHKEPDLEKVYRLLNSGWRITHVATAGFGDGLGYGYYQTYFVLEGPTVAPATLTSGVVSPANAR